MARYSLVVNVTIEAETQEKAVSAALRVLNTARREIKDVTKWVQTYRTLFLDGEDVGRVRFRNEDDYL
jgi:hypothetical protein